MIEFERIRGHGRHGSRADGFEELVSQLFMDGLIVDLPPGTGFDRTGNPDGGREGRAVTPSGEVFVWQAKYLFGLDAAAFGQITGSIRRILETEPEVKQIYIALPYDRPAGDTTDTTSAMTRWKAKVLEWTEEADQAGRSVEFFYVGASEMASILTRPDQAGRLRYWFDTAVFTAESFAHHVEDAIENAGPRYTPTLHVDMPVAGVLHGVARTPEFETVLRAHLAELREGPRFGWYAPPESDAFPDLMATADAAIARLDRKMALAISCARTSTALPELDDAVADTFTALGALQQHLHAHCLHDRDYFTGTAAGLYTALRRLERAVDDIATLARGPIWKAAETGVVVLVGEAGTGKTHLLCDFARTRVETAPMLLTYGNAFDRRDPLVQVVEQTRFEGSAGEFLDTLDAAAEAWGEKAVLMIDAINESDDPDLWQRTLAGIVNEVHRRPHIALVVSCRTLYARDLIPDSVRRTSAVATHRGFAETPREAVDTYLRGFGIERPSFPLLEPEFTNPLLLKLVCTTLRARGEKRLPRDGISISWLFAAYLEAVNRRLADRQRCDFDSAEGLVQQAVDALAIELADGERSLPRTEARQIIDSLLPGRNWSTSLFKGLLDEGVLLPIRHRDGDRITFGYERLGDTAVAARISAGDLDEVRAAGARLADQWWLHAGRLAALAIAVPERHEVELVDLLELRGDALSGRAAESFLASLGWRSLESITPRTVELAGDLVGDAEEPGWSALVRLATIPNHPLNARWLHRHLSALTLSVRDRTWTAWTASDQAAEIDTLLDWCWSDDSCASGAEVRTLAAITLGWLFTSTSRPVRDQATVAAVSLLDGDGPATAEVVSLLAGVDDTYVVERVLAVACGVASRGGADVATTIGAAVAAWWSTTALPPHLLARDYARRCVRAALDAGWDDHGGVSSRSDPPYGEPWPLATRTDAEVERLTGPPDYAYSSISVGEWDDFRVKTIRHIVDDYADVPNDVEALVSRRVFDRVLELGWTPERFDAFDHGRHWEPSRNELVERVGKKYQWIGLYEELGRLADNFQVGGRYTDDPRRVYDDPSDIDVRDIDPTRILRGTGIGGYDDTPPCWWVPSPVTFDERDPDAWIRDASGLPDPLDLLIVGEDVSWLTLESHNRWHESQPPDVAARRPPQRQGTLSIQTALVAIDALSAIENWCRARLWAAELPDAPELSGRLLWDHPMHPTWADADGAVRFGGSQPPPFSVTSTAAWYRSGRDRDCSGARAEGVLPTLALIERADLARRADFDWVDRDGELACIDPSAAASGRPSLLLRADLAGRCTSAGQTLLWQVAAEKNVSRPEHRYRDDVELWWVEARAFYVLDSGVVRRVASEARSLKRGPTVEKIVDWSLSESRSTA